MKTYYLSLVFTVFVSACVIAQTSYDESETLDNLPSGIIFQTGPGTTNSLNWLYPYGTKLTVNGGIHRNFELGTIGKSNEGLLVRQYNQTLNDWTSWKKILLDDGNGNVRINDNKSFFFGNSGTPNASIKLGSDDVLRFYNSDNEEKINFPVGGGDSRIVLQPNGGFVGIGTSTPDEKLSVNGNIHTKEVRVDLTGWSDFVFEEDYQLPTLEEVEKHIKGKGHLKDIPPAEEVKENGIFLGEMDSKLLQKIEELMLYTIQQQKEIKNQKNKIEKLEKDNKSLNIMVKRLDEIEKVLSIKKKP